MLIYISLIDRVAFGVHQEKYLIPFTTCTSPRLGIKKFPLHLVPFDVLHYYTLPSSSTRKNIDSLVLFFDNIGGGFQCGAMRNLPTFSTDFGKIVYIFGELCKTGILSDTEMLCFERQNRVPVYGKVPILRTLILLVV